MSKPVVLFLAANPKGTTELALTAECAAITRELMMTPGRADFDLQQRWAVTVDDLARELNELQPTLVHFSGHGNAQGIALLAEDGTAHCVSPEALAGLLDTASKEGAPSPTRAVVLNACYSDEQARVLANQVGCAVGMKGTISDEAARAFSVAFYRALGHGSSIHNAYRQARATLSAKGLDLRAAPQCLTRSDVDAREIIPRPLAMGPPLPAPSRRDEEDDRAPRRSVVTNNTGESVIHVESITTSGHRGAMFDLSRRK